MLSGAKHLRFFFLGEGPNENDQRFFAKPVLSKAEGIRMTLSGLFRHSIIHHSSFVICLLAFVAGIGTAFAEKRPITEKDLFDFAWIGDPQISPDGSRIAFVRVTVNEKKEGYNTSIWSVPLAGGEAPHQLTCTIGDPADRRRRFLCFY